MFRLIVADGQAVVRAGSRRLLNSWTACYELAEASNAHEVRTLVEAGGWQVLLLDLRLPGAEGLELLRQIQNLHRELKVLVWGGIPEEHFAVDAIRSGSYGFVSKQDPPDELLTAFEQVIKGKRYVSARLGQLMADQLTISSSPHELLSARERQVFDCLAAGMKTGRIAQELGVTIATVSTYRARACKKLNLVSNAEMALYAARYRLSAVAHANASIDSGRSVALELERAEVLDVAESNFGQRDNRGSA